MNADRHGPRKGLIIVNLWKMPDTYKRPINPPSLCGNEPQESHPLQQTGPSHRERGPGNTLFALSAAVCSQSSVRKALIIPLLHKMLNQGKKSPATHAVCR